MAHWKTEFYDNSYKYIGCHDLQPDEKRVVKIIGITPGVEITGEGGKKDIRPVADLEGNKPFILNKKNCIILERIFESDPASWIGKKVTIFAATHEEDGKPIRGGHGLRIIPKRPELPILKEGTKGFNQVVQGLKNGATFAQVRTVYQVSPELESKIKTLLTA